jgi:hypothetical protein
MDLRNLLLLPIVFMSVVSCGSVNSLTSKDLPPAEPESKVINGLESVSAKVIGTCEESNLNFKYLSAGGVYDSSDLGNIKTYSLNLFLNEDQTYQIRLMVYDQTGTKFADEIHNGTFTFSATDFVLENLGTAYISKVDGKLRFVLNMQAHRLPAAMNGKQIQMRSMTSPNGLVNAEDYCSLP